MPDVKAVVFDIGNVLIEWQPERFYETIMPAVECKKMFETIVVDVRLKSKFKVTFISFEALPASSSTSAVRYSRIAAA